MSASTGRAVLSIGGQIVGAFFGGPIGAAIGGGLASAAGWALFPENNVVEGPRLNDLKVTTSAYGETLPICYGGMRVAGKLIWEGALREDRTEEDVSGKGGPTQTQVTYRYFKDFAVALCEGPIIGVAKIWVDGELVYNTSAGATLQQIYASGAWGNVMTLYPGSETQPVDPLIEATLGVGNACAYRGTAYLVFSDLDITNYGRIPNIEAEVITAGTANGVSRLGYSTFTSGVDGSNDGMLFNVVDGTIRFTYTNATRVSVFDLGFVGLFEEPRNYAEQRYPDWGFYGTVKLGGQYGQTVLFPDYAKLYSDVPSGAATFGSGSARITVLDGIVQVSVHTLLPSGEFFHALVPCADLRRFVVLSAPSSGAAATKWYLLQWSGSGVSIERSGTVDVGGTPIGARGRVGQGEFTAGMLEQNLRHLWLATTTGQAVELWNLDGDNVMRRQAQLTAAFSPGAGSGFNAVSVYADNGVAVVYVGAASAYFYVFTRLTTGLTDSVTLATVAESICTKAGYTVGELDLAALTDTVDGYAIPRATSARSALEPLQRAYWFDLIESGGKLKGVKRGGASAATVPGADLLLLDGVPGGDTLPAERSRPSEPPREVTVTYYAAGADYQQGAQRDSRVSSVSSQLVNVSLPLVLTDDRAKQVASVLLYDAGQQVKRRRLATWRKWAELEPGDVITVSGGSAALTLRLTNRVDRGALLEFEAAEEAADVYTKVAPGGTTPGAGSLVGVGGATFAALMDAPLLADADDYPGYYAAFRGYLSGWPGGRLYRSADGGATYDAVALATTAAVVGVAIDALGNYSGLNVLDEGNSVTVSLLSGGTLSSTTFAALVASTTLNVAFLGGEIIQFRDATLQSAGKYRLTGLRRGLLGTERLQGSHVEGEVFALLTAGTLRRVQTALSEIGAERLFKPVTAGNSIAVAAAQEFTDGGAALKPLAPVLLNAGRHGSADIVLGWTRRSRVGAATWLDGSDVPLGEDSEAYEVEILNVTTGTVLRTLTNLTAPTATWTSAQQTADTGGSATQVRFRVYQLSARVGRGFAAEATLGVPL